MGLAERQELIKAIEKARGSKVLTYVLSDRMNAPPAIIADDAIRPIHEILNLFGKTEKIDLFLYTRGGQSTSSFRITKLIREYCKKFSVLIPWRAHSAGTQISLGADQIVMGALSELSPVDPSTTGPFNPIDQRGQQLPISVEDVLSFLKFAREKAGLTSESSKLDTFKILTAQAPALALANVNRVYEESRRIVEELLMLHMDEFKQKAEVEKIKQFLTEEYTHQHYITRDRARKVGLPVLDADSAMEGLLEKLFQEYEAQLKLGDPFDPEVVLGQLPSATFNLWYGLIETASLGFVAYGEGAASRSIAQLPQINIPGMAAPINPAASIMPVSVKFKPSKWVKSTAAPAGV